MSKKKTIVREIFTVVHEYESSGSMDDIISHCQFVEDEVGEFLHDILSNDNTTVKFQIKEKVGWKNLKV